MSPRDVELVLKWTDLTEGRCEMYWAVIIIIVNVQPQCLVVGRRPHHAVSRFLVLSRGPDIQCYTRTYLWVLLTIFPAHYLQRKVIWMCGWQCLEVLTVTCCSTTNNNGLVPAQGPDSDGVVENDKKAIYRWVTIG